MEDEPHKDTEAALYHIPGNIYKRRFPEEKGVIAEIAYDHKSCADYRPPEPKEKAAAAVQVAAKQAAGIAFQSLDEERGRSILWMAVKIRDGGADPPDERAPGSPEKERACDYYCIAKVLIT
jgi:hypothetical protein